MSDFDAVTYLQAALDSIREAFPAVPTVEAFPRLRKKVTCPAIFVELGLAAGTDDPGTDELAFALRFEARVVFDQAPVAVSEADPQGGPPTRRITDPELEALRLAAALAVHVKQHAPFGEPAGLAKNLRLEPDHFRPDLAEYNVWLLEWTHPEVRFGASSWDGEGVTPTEVYLGMAPEIGEGHAADYVRVVPGE